MAQRRSVRQVFGLTWPPPEAGPEGPDPVVLDNGDVLVPTRAEGGEFTMTRITVGEPDHARWLADVQRQANRASDGLVLAGFILALLLPVVGVVVGIVVAARRREGAGLLIVLLAVVCGVGGYVLLTS
jgi:hypothetical protein